MLATFALGLALLAAAGLTPAQSPAPTPSPTPTPTPKPTPHPTPVPGNLLTNAGFEKGKGTRAEEWSLHEGAARTGELALMGDWAVHISSLKGGAITRLVPVQPNTFYVAQYWHKSGVNGVPGPMAFYIFGKEEQRYIIADGSRLEKPIDWTLRGAVFNSGNNQNISFEMSLSTAAGPVGELYFDECAIYPHPNPAALAPRAAVLDRRSRLPRPFQVLLEPTAISQLSIFPLAAAAAAGPGAPIS
jgi:hypothetical protein